MAEIIEFFGNFFSWLEALPAVWAYAVLLLIAYGENVVPPIPGDMIVVFGGYMAGIGKLDLGVVILLATIGGAVGFMNMYALGYYFGESVLRSDRYTWLPHEGIDRAQRWLEKYGYGVVAANRFLSGARSVISLAVGAARMSAWKTAAYATLSAGLWTAIIAYAGYAVGDNWKIIGDYLRSYGRIMISVLAVVAVGLLIRAYLRRRKANRSMPAKEEGSSAAPEHAEPETEETRHGI